MSTALKRMRVDEFLPWAEGRAGRWELFDGQPVMMSPERVGHNLTKLSVAIALTEAVRMAGVPCRVYTDGLAISIDGRASYGPDASVVCGPNAATDAVSIDNPMIIVEVLSPSTAAIDHGPKLSGYFSLPSVEHYLILDPDRRVVIHHKRGQAETIETRVLSEGAVKLEPPGFEVPIAAMFPEVEATRSG